jgi:succinoglycan biosynthesis transport protein ExoP
LRARRRQAEQILRERDDQITSETLVRLRDQYFLNVALERVFTNRFGANHAVTVRRREQTQEIRRDINNEIIRIARGAKSDYEIALAPRLMP